MVLEREEVAHKLPRTASSENIPEESGKQTRPVVARQPNSCGLYKQLGSNQATTLAREL